MFWFIPHQVPQGFDLPSSVMWYGTTAEPFRKNLSFAEGFRIEVYLKLQLFYYECFSYLII